MNRVEHFSFTSAGLDPDAAFDRYRELYSLGSDVTRGEGPFRAEVRAWRLDNLLLFDRRLSGLVHSREDRVAVDGFDHFVLSYLVSGSARGAAAGPFELRAGEMVLFDTSRPMRMESDKAHVVTVSIARTVVEAAVGAIGRLHGRRLQPPDALLLADFLESLVERAEVLPARMLPAIGRAFIELLSSAIAESAKAGAEARRLQFARREAAIRHVSAYLGERALCAESIAEAAGVSRSALYRLFEREGGIGRLIQRMRLDALRTALEQGEAASLAELAQHFGFSGESHMSRLFSEAYGCAPGAYRRAVSARTEPNDPTALKRRWAGWMIELD